MPHESHRSGLYRSFVSCHDPKGVVECGTFRKYKTSSKTMENKSESRRTSKSLSKGDKKEMDSKAILDEFKTPSSIQLLEVSKGAQKLNEMSGSWSKNMNFDGQSKVIAKDLLKGALDLQDSLVMLGKLQEASEYMSRLKKKHNQKVDLGRSVDDLGISRLNFNRFSDHDSQTGFQQPRHSTDGSSRNCAEELKMVIRDSLVKQNLLLDSTVDQRLYFDRRKMDLGSDIPSTSSSQSSTFQSSSFDWSEHSKKGKSPNLIAKLMGLEENPLKPMKITLERQLESEKILNQRKPMFNMDMPKPRKPQIAAEKVDPERRTLKEVLETVKFKGFLESNSSEVYSPQKFYDDTPPIVIMKPIRVPCVDGASDTKDILRKLRKGEVLPMKEKTNGEEAPVKKRTSVKEAPTKKATDCEVNLMKKKVEYGEPPAKKTTDRQETPVKKTTDREESPAKRTVNRADSPTRRVNRSDSPTRRVNRSDSPTRRGNNEGDKDQRNQEVKMKKSSSHKAKTSVPVIHKVQKNEGIEKRDEILQKAVEKMPVEKETLKSKTVVKLQEQAKETSTKLKRRENGSNNKDLIPQKQSFISKISGQTTSHKSIDRKKNQTQKGKPNKEAGEAKIVTQNLGCDKDGNGIKDKCKSDLILIRSDTTLADLLDMKEVVIDASDIQTGDDRAHDSTDLAKVTRPNNQREAASIIKSVEECSTLVHHNRTKFKRYKTRTTLQSFLVSSSSFIDHAEELFDLNMSQPIIFQTTRFDESEIANPKLTLDCANELMERKSRMGTSSSRKVVSLDLLVEEVCDGIENLRSYSKLFGEKGSSIGVYIMVDRDFTSKEMSNANWELGWRSLFSFEEIGLVASEVEKQVLDDLIQEVFIDTAI